MADIKLGSKTYAGVTAVKLDTTAGGAAIFTEQPTVTAIDYSTWDSGTFSETLDTGAKLDYAVEKDTEGRPIKVTRPDGSEVEVAW